MMVNYGNYNEFKEKLINKRIIKWDEEELALEDGTRVTIQCSDYDCCAYAHGHFKDVELDAMITDVSTPDVKGIPDEHTIVNQAKVTIFHNRNVVAQAEVVADAGNGGYYYSVGSFVIDDVHYRVVDA